MLVWGHEMQNLPLYSTLKLRDQVLHLRRMSGALAPMPQNNQAIEKIDPSLLHQAKMNNRSDTGNYSNSQTATSAQLFGFSQKSNLNSTVNQEDFFVANGKCDQDLKVLGLLASGLGHRNSLEGGLTANILLERFRKHINELAKDMNINSSEWAPGQLGEIFRLWLYRSKLIAEATMRSLEDLMICANGMVKNTDRTELLCSFAGAIDIGDRIIIFNSGDCLAGIIANKDEAIIDKNFVTEQQIAGREESANALAGMFGFIKDPELGEVFLPSSSLALDTKIIKKQKLIKKLGHDPILVIMSRGLQPKLRYEPGDQQAAKLLNSKEYLKERNQSFVEFVKELRKHKFGDPSLSNKLAQFTDKPSDKTAVIGHLNIETPKKRSIFEGFQGKTNWSLDSMLDQQRNNDKY